MKLKLKSLKRGSTPTRGLKDVDVLILCGGKGERLKSQIADRPKPMAEIGGKPFLEILVEYLLSHGFRRFILSVGHLKGHIINYFENYDFNNKDSFRVEFSEEEVPLGTGGALKRAKNFIQSENFLVLNGDSFCPVNLVDFYNAHLNNDSLFSMVVSAAEDLDNYGNIVLHSSGRVLDFREKGSRGGSGLVSAGIYFMNKDIFCHLPEKDIFSLEHDLFPKILDKYCHGFVSRNKFIDIGTPKRYEEARQIFSKS